MEKKLSRRKMLRRKYKNYAAALAGAALLTGAGAAIPATTFAAENPANFQTIDQQALADSHAGGARYSTRDNSSSHYDTRNNSSSHYDTRYDSSRNNDRVNYTRSDRNNGASYDTRYNSGSHYDTRYNNGSHYDTRYNRDGWHRHDNSWPSSGDNRALYKNGQIYYSNDGYSSNDYGNYLTSPLTVARDYASSYGFNANLDTFTLLSQSDNKATVQVIKHDSNQQFRMNLARTNGGDWSITGVRA
jgi:hypothetical protein